MVGARVGELIGEAQLIYSWDAQAEDVAALIHAHPTQNEAIGEATSRWPASPCTATPDLPDRNPASTQPPERPTTRSRPMSFSVQMPALGESVTEGTVTRWLKQEGDRSRSTSRCSRSPPTRSTPRSPPPPRVCWSRSSPGRTRPSRSAASWP